MAADLYCYYGSNNCRKIFSLSFTTPNNRLSWTTAFGLYCWIDHEGWREELFDVSTGWDTRTSSWWDNFVDGRVGDSEWRENFHMSSDSIACTSAAKQRTWHALVHRRAKKLAVTLCNLNSEGRQRKTANAFGLSRAFESIVVRQTAKASPNI